ncbi:MAG: FkbM family methyltransferase [Actinomycetota bacterium]
MRSVFSRSKIRCYPSSGSASNLIYFGDFYEYDEMLFVKRYLRRGDGFIDGGANIGTFSLLAAELVGATGRVDAFEPVPEPAGWFRENMALNDYGWVHLHEAALGERSGTVDFFSDRDVSNHIALEPAKDTIQVPCVTLDEALPVEGRYAMAKLDLEGAQVAALRGAERHLSEQNPPVWQVEVFQHLLLKMGSDLDELISLFTDHGYSLCSYDADGNHLNRDIDLRREAQAGRQDAIAIARTWLDDVTNRLGTN